MVAISILIEGQQGLTWARWKRLIETAETSGLAGLFTSDHFTDPQPANEPPSVDALEAIIALAYLADHTQRIHFGPLVAPISMRDPVSLARQAAAIDELSNGRMWLGIGAGWQDREHATFGYTLGDVATRMARYEEAVEIAVRLLHSTEPLTFEGKYYTLHEARLLPRPQKPTTIVIGGNGIKRTLTLAARYADVWNGTFLSPAEFKERSSRLDSLLEKEGRAASAVRRTLMHTVIFGRDQADLERQFEKPQFKGVLEAVKNNPDRGKPFIGTPDQLIEQIKLYKEAGVEEFFFQWLDMDDVDGLRAFAESVVSHA